MLRCGICDDEAVQLDFLQSLVADWAAARGHEMGIERFPSAESLLFAFDEDPGFDLLLLDIQMGGMDGVTLARRIRQTNEDLQIIFITAFADFMAQGYEVSALHYLMKPVSKEKLHETLDKAFGRLQRAEPVLLLQSDKGTRRIAQREILYAEALSPVVRVVCKGEVYETRQRFAEVKAALDPGAFVRCHRSYVVGLRHVARLDRAEVLLDDGQRLPLARRSYEAVQQAFIRYYKGDRL